MNNNTSVAALIAALRRDLPDKTDKDIYTAMRVLGMELTYVLDTTELDALSDVMLAAFRQFTAYDKVKPATALVVHVLAAAPPGATIAHLCAHDRPNSRSIFAMCFVALALCLRHQPDLLSTETQTLAE